MGDQNASNTYTRNSTHTHTHWHAHLHADTRSRTHATWTASLGALLQASRNCTSTSVRGTTITLPYPQLYRNPASFECHRCPRRRSAHQQRHCCPPGRPEMRLTKPRREPNRRSVGRRDPERRVPFTCPTPHNAQPVLVFALRPKTEEKTSLKFASHAILKKRGSFD